MAAEEREQLVVALAEVMASRTAGSDLLLSAFSSALHSGRKTAICTPFPPAELFLNTPSTSTPAPLTPSPSSSPSQQRLPPPALDKQFSAAQRAFAELSAVPQLQHPATLSSLSTPALRLLSWLLLHPTRQRRFFPVTLADMESTLQSPVTAGLHPNQLPSYILRYDDPTPFPPPAHTPSASPPLSTPAATAAGPPPAPATVLGFHGTHLDSLHSIINTGLQVVSGTRLQRNGAIFGSGIYLSTTYGTAFMFCEPGKGWPHSGFGDRLRCMLVCSVAEEADAVGECGADGRPVSAEEREAVPATYLLVRRPTSIRLRYVLIFRDGGGGGVGRSPVGGGPAPGPGGRLNWCTVLIVLYVAFLACHGLFNRSTLRWLGF